MLVTHRGILKKRIGDQTVATAVDEFLKLFLESGCNYLKIVCDGFLADSLWKRDLVKKLACFKSSVLFF